MEFISSPLCVRSCFPVWFLPLVLCFPPPPCCSIFPGLQFLVLGLSGPPPFLRREQERCCTMAVLLIKVNSGVISLYCSYHGISPGTGSEAKDGPQSTADNGACKSAAGDKFWQIEIAEKFPCWAVRYQRLTLPPKSTRWIIQPSVLKNFRANLKWFLSLHNFHLLARPRNF